MKGKNVLTGLGTAAGLAAIASTATYMMMSNKPAVKKIRNTAKKTAQGMMKK